ncbi:GLPGLI family protein [Chryseobacterium arachidis]|uniref:GLPGLI family protein n=1 Tax=Chryseobacterium arachidis TaxID=1416778 RepID=A0A1M5BM37_9FLAO|nr:GLPGLI family protein [Chryseobacterium arachidis]SHF43559.1 GLPGLI family protein [Chryseobacterium arachidis]
MKKLIIVFAVFLSCAMNAQNQRFVYEYKFISDSTAKNEVKTERMYLDVSKKGSKFYSEVKYIADSIKEDRLKKGFRDLTGINFNFIPFVVEKSYPDYKNFFFISLSLDRFKVSEERPQTWKIMTEKEKIGEFNAQKATLDFAGRKWNAWFVPDIPIQDGPYKFHGLPGMIVKIEDQTNSHSFTLKEIKKLSEDWASESEKKSFSNIIPVNTAQYKKQFVENRNDPTKGLRQMFASGRKLMMVDESGKPLEQQTILRMREKEGKEQNAKNNNLLELDLLK